MTAEQMVRDAIMENLAPMQPFTLETPLVELRADSLDVVELVMVFEDNLNVDVPDEEISKLRTVADVVELVKRHTGEA